MQKKTLNTLSSPPINYHGRSVLNVKQSSADYNSDGTVNVIDIVAIVELILGN